MAKSIQMKDVNNENIYPYALLKEFVLYDNSTGTIDTVTLSDNVSNYKYVEIFYRNNDNQYSSVKVYNANNKKISLLTCFVSGDYFMLKGSQVQIVDNKITKRGYCEGNAYNQTTLTNKANNTYITRVVGYK